MALLQIPTYKFQTTNSKADPEQRQRHLRHEGRRQRCLELHQQVAENDQRQTAVDLEQADEDAGRWRSAADGDAGTSAASSAVASPARAAVTSNSGVVSIWPPCIGRNSPCRTCCIGPSEAVASPSPSGTPSVEPAAPIRRASPKNSARICG